MKEKVVLAYSGGLDTSYCVKYLSEELGLEVYTALANTGGFTEAELKTVEKKAYALGAKEHVNLDVTEDYYEKCIRYMVFGNVLRNKTYPVSVSSERTFHRELCKKSGSTIYRSREYRSRKRSSAFRFVFCCFCPGDESNYSYTRSETFPGNGDRVPESPWCPFRLEENGIFGKQRYMGNFCRGKRNFTFQYEFTG